MIRRGQIPVWAYLFHHPTLSRRSGMGPLVEAVGAEAVYYDVVWERLQARSWRLGQAVRRLGQRWSGSEWFAPLPLWDEWRFVRRLPRGRPSIAHYVFADFTPPMLIDYAHARGSHVAATFHCSARRMPQVLGGIKRLEDIDAITLMSASQRPFFIDRGVPPERVHVMLHGVDTTHFHPGRHGSEEGPLRLLLVGKTERDHAFAAEVMRGLPANTAALRVSTVPDHHVHYLGLSNTTLLPRLSDEELLKEYQRSDALLMPMLDCTANNAILESMACGTPVLANRVGGVPEYITGESGFVLPGKDAAQWVDLLVKLRRHRAELVKRRAAARARAEELDWPIVGRQYLDLFAELLRKPLA